MAYLGVTLVLLPACFVARVEGGPPEPGPEQFVFTMVPGGGRSDEATKVVTDAFGGPTLEVDHRASVATPVGDLSFYRYIDVEEGEEWACTAILGEFGGSGSCGDPEADEPDPEVLLVAFIGLDGDWSTVAIRAGRAVGSATAIAADTTVYRTNFIDGFGLIVYPTGRGALLIQALDRAGELLGEPVSSEADSG